jgi:hypothetical protein
MIDDLQPDYRNRTIRVCLIEERLEFACSRLGLDLDTWGRFARLLLPELYFDGDPVERPPPRTLPNPTGPLTPRKPRGRLSVAHPGDGGDDLHDLDAMSTAH